MAGGGGKSGLPKSALTAQLTFCGRMLGALSSGMMAVIELTTPTTDPKIVVTVYVDKGSSSLDAAPIAARIIRHIFGYPDVAPKPPPTTRAPPRARHHRSPVTR